MSSTESSVPSTTAPAGQQPASNQPGDTTEHEALRSSDSSSVDAAAKSMAGLSMSFGGGNGSGQSSDNSTSAATTKSYAKVATPAAALAESSPELKRNETTSTSSAIGTRCSGRVKFFNSQKGYGFIIPHDPSIINLNGRNEIFVHHTAITTGGSFRSLAEGEEVEFDLVNGAKGLMASAVSGPDGAPVLGDWNYSWKAERKQFGLPPYRQPMMQKGGFESYDYNSVARGQYAAPNYYTPAMMDPSTGEYYPVYGAGQTFYYPNVTDTSTTPSQPSHSNPHSQIDARRPSNPDTASSAATSGDIESDSRISPPTDEEPPVHQ